MKRLVLLTTMFLITAIATTAVGSPPTTRPGPDSAMLIGSPGKASLNLYPVEFVAIDGRQIGARDTIWLEPGTYTLTVRMLVRNPPGAQHRPALRQKMNTQIEVVMEAGKTYHVLARYDRTQREGPYTTVLYRVTDT